MAGVIFTFHEETENKEMNEDAFPAGTALLLKNRAATLVMIGVCLLPSLYAWFNIAANMDPYANTSGIRVAIANCDTGTKADVITMNAGDSIVEKLKENKSLGWQFVSEEKAKEGVQAGDYYAAIVIPENFSSSLVSILSGDLKRPKLDYYVNEKKNAIAPKITDSGDNGATADQRHIFRHGIFGSIRNCKVFRRQYYQRTGRH